MASMLTLINFGVLADENLGKYDTGPTLGIQYNKIMFDDLDINAVTLTGGYQWNRYFTTELRVGTSFESAEETIIETSIPYLYSGIAKIHYPVTKRFRPYIIGGYSEGKLQLEANYNSSKLKESVKGNDFTYGVGFSYLAKNKGVYADIGMEYLVYGDVLGTLTSGINVVLNIRL